ncbi:hypothetical protein KQI74_02755 [Paenibacillus barcinonensis]|uniref:hypothetical protein n=1 Tax=Paenibacillus barcinonensis TaxID=198119 RepID=UPI001C122EAA|nr:hypothetical protein [Paenibacillus barcinonensis]MBU5351183.1 hypothetical protein [Paenibacillus barcinonensis]
MNKQTPAQNGKNDTQDKMHDQPEQYKTENESLLDRYEQEQTVDPIPMQDLNMEAQEEKNKHQTKSNSSTEEKYRADYRKRNE